MKSILGGLWSTFMRAAKSNAAKMMSAPPSIKVPGWSNRWVTVPGRRLDMNRQPIPCIYPRDRSKYMPHEGRRQIERQQKQHARRMA